MAVIEMEQYTRPKTVRFTPDSFQLIAIGARAEGVTTSEYIRSIVLDAIIEDTEALE
jgi:hypothetical protein